MKAKIKRAFKNYSVCHHKKTKNKKKNNKQEDRLRMKFPEHPIQVYSKCLNPLLQNQLLFIVTPLFQRISQDPGKDQ